MAETAAPFIGNVGLLNGLNFMTEKLRAQQEIRSNDNEPVKEEERSPEEDVKAEVDVEMVKTEEEFVVQQEPIDESAADFSVSSSGIGTSSVSRSNGSPSDDISGASMNGDIDEQKIIVDDEPQNSIEPSTPRSGSSVTNFDESGAFPLNPDLAPSAIGPPPPAKPGLGNKFECDICHKTFSNAANMRRHRVRHTGIKPFQCRFCGKRFFRKDHMREHMNHKHNNTQMECYFCQMEFDKENEMFQHVIRDHGVNPKDLHCMYCNFQATTMGRLLWHLTTAHPRKAPPTPKSGRRSNDIKLEDSSMLSMVGFDQQNSGSNEYLSMAVNGASPFTARHAAAILAANQQQALVDMDMEKGKKYVSLIDKSLLFSRGEEIGAAGASLTKNASTPKSRRKSKAPTKFSGISDETSDPAAAAASQTETPPSSTTAETSSATPPESRSAGASSTPPGTSLAEIVSRGTSSASPGMASTPGAEHLQKMNAFHPVSSAASSTTNNSLQQVMFSAKMQSLLATNPSLLATNVFAQAAAQAAIQQQSVQRTSSATLLTSSPSSVARRTGAGASASAAAVGGNPSNMQSQIERMHSILGYSSQASNPSAAMAVAAAAAAAAQHPQRSVANGFKEANDLETALATGKFKCPYCHIEYPDITMYMLHSLLHSSREDPFRCSVCQAQYPNRYEFFAHLISHRANPVVNASS